MNNQIKRLLPYNVSSGSYILSQSRKLISKHNSQDDSNMNENKNKKKYIFFPKYEGRVYDPTTNKTIEQLKKSEEQIIKDLSRINSNEKLLKSKSFINMFNNNIKNISEDKKKIEEKIKNLKYNRNICMDKLGELQMRINTLQYKQEKELGILQYNKKMKLNKFIEDYNNKKSRSLIEKKIKKLREESDKIQVVMQKDLEKKIEKKIKDINIKKKEEEQKRIEILKKMHDEEREEIIKRKQKNNEELLKIKEYVNKKPNDKVYLYQKKLDKYISDENNLVKLENIKRKAIMKHIDLKEFSEMQKNYEEIHAKKILESNEKMENIKKSWSERHKLIPLYISPISKLIIEEDNKNKQEQQNKIMKIKDLKTLQINYSKNKVPKPALKIIEKSSFMRNEKGSGNINNSNIIKPYFKKSNSYSSLLRKKILDRYRERQEQNRSDESLSKNEELLSKKNKNKKYNNKVIDYLKERRKIKELKKERLKSLGRFSSYEYSGTKEISHLIKSNGINDDILKVVKTKLDSIDSKKKQKDILLKYSGGTAKNPELSDEICDLMIDSIQAKLNLIKKMDKDLDNSLEENNKSVKETKTDNNNTKSRQSDIHENSIDEEEEYSEEN